MSVICSQSPGTSAWAVALVVTDSPGGSIGYGGAYQPKARETERSIGRTNTSPEADPPVVEVSDRGVTGLPTATKE